MNTEEINRSAGNSGTAANAEALVYFYLFNVGMLMVVGHAYLSNVPQGTSFPGWLATLLAFAANFAMLALVPLILSLLALVARRGWVTLTAAVVLFGFLNFFIYADSVIYSLWRFHFNAVVWNLITTPGSADNVIAGRSTVLTTLLIVILIFAAEIAFAVFALPWLGRRPNAAASRNKKASLCCGAVVLSLIALDKAGYAVGDLRDNQEILRVRQLLPLYQPLTMRKLGHQLLGIKTSAIVGLKMHNGAGSFDYPKAPLRFRPDAPHPNILIIAVEGGRFDMLTPDVMPFLSHWGATNLVFNQNYSAGNTTRYGIFGLIHGIYGTYWQRALAERQGPVLIRSLKPLGYNFRILCGTSLNYPEFRSTCFVDVPEAITDSWKGERVDRDRLMTDELIRFVDENKKPFFGFMFYIASHQPYYYPPNHAVFDTGGVSEDLNYIKLAHAPAQMEQIKNRYKNSLHYVDAEIERVLKAMEDRGLMNNTLVFMLGDHGEEFRELGLFGHDSSFDKYQTKTFMVAHIPGEAPRKIERLTSHMDVPSTILTYMGVENPLSDYTQGIPLLSAEPRPFVFIASWDNAAIEDGKMTTTFGTETYNTEMTVFDQNYTPLLNQREAISARQAQLLDTLGKMKQFTR
ncbi:MAG: sulfatase-like hydrolase/transferase [Verrucomicrobia bacterium]|nr:sulfatase-like hydrolase/transferase [Verrucomicrobiota bacterium]